MAKIFRRIREQLLKEGRLKNYLLYAAGEIVLVMIGILLALQINNWNEERKARLLENVYYCKMLEDVMQDQVLLENLMTENESRIRNSNKMISLMQQNSPIRKEVVTATRGATAKTTFTFKPSKSAFEDLKSSGNLNIITDLVLKNRLIHYYSFLEGYVDVVDVNSDAAVAMYYNLKKDYAEIGWQDLESVRKEIDTTLVDLRALEARSYPSAEARKEMLSEAIFYLGTNVRKKELYKTMCEEIVKMKGALEEKCGVVDK